MCDSLIHRDLAEDAAEREAGLTVSPNIVLLSDLHAVWPAREGLVPTLELVDALRAHNGQYWGPQSGYGKALTEHRFARMVAQACKVTSQRPGGRGPRGFFRAQFDPIWARLRSVPRSVRSVKAVRSYAVVTPQSLHRTDLTDLTGCTGLNGSARRLAVRYQAAPCRTFS